MIQVMQITNTLLKPHFQESDERSKSYSHTGTEFKIVFFTAIAKHTDDVEFMVVWLYNLFLHFQQKKMAH
jgi:hypothetical protein